jgi:hypothetical protein
VLELRLGVVGGAAAVDGAQLVLHYLFASEEYGALSPNPDSLSITISPAGGLGSSSLPASGAAAAAAAAADGGGGGGPWQLALLPGGMRLPPPGVDESAAGFALYRNAHSQYRTAWDAFTEVRHVLL